MYVHISLSLCISVYIYIYIHYMTSNSIIIRTSSILTSTIKQFYVSSSS